MLPIEINPNSAETILESFTTIATKIFNNFQLEINKNYYRFLDIEFYYSSESFKDIYAHRHPEQLKMNKWYFHGSGIDMTIGNGENYGGILIRGLAKLSGEISPDKLYVEKEIHGQLNVQTEICSKFHDIFSEKANTFCLHDISRDRQSTMMKIPTHIIKTRRIGLNASKDTSPDKVFYNGKYRFVIFPHLKLKDKTQIATDMRSQYPDYSFEEISKLLGSKFHS